VGSNYIVITVWDVNTGALLHAYTGHVSQINSLSFSPDEKTLASGSGDGTIILWNVTP